MIFIPVRFKLTDQDLIPLIRKGSFKNLEYLPLVENPANTLNDYVTKNAHKNIQITKTSDLNDGFFKFVEQFSNSNAVILTGTSASPLISRSKRDAISSNGTNSAFGTQCAATYQNVYVNDAINTLSPTPSLLTVTSDSFSCETDSSTLV
jgi:hypothetical protein